MEKQVWQVVQSALSTEPQGAEDLVRLTLPKLSRTAEDSNKLLQNYIQLAQRLRFLTKKDPFWEWLETQFPDLDNPIDPNIDSQTQKLLTAEVMTVLSNKSFGRNPLNLVARLCQNWWLFFVVYFCVCVAFGELPWDLIEVSHWLRLGGTTIGSTLNILASVTIFPCLLSFSISPWSGTWRRQFFKRSGLVTAVFTTVFVWIVVPAVTWTLAWGVASMGYKKSYYPESLKEVIISGIFNFSRQFSNDHGDLSLFLAAIVSFFLFWALAVVTKSRPWIRNWSSSLWRKSVLVVLCIPVLVSLFRVVSLHQEGQLNPELAQIFAERQPDWWQVPPNKPPSDIIEAYYKELGFTQGKSMASIGAHGFVSFTESLDFETFFGTWLKTGDIFWKDPSWWKKPEARQYTLLALDIYRLRSYEQSQEPLEFFMRAAFFSRNFDVQLVEMISSAQKTPEEWDKFFVLALQLCESGRQDIRESLDYEQALVNHFGRIDQSTPTSMSEWISHWEMNSGANKVWAHYLAKRASYKDETALTPAQRDAFSKDALLSNILRYRVYAEAKQDLNVLALLCVELKQKQATGSPLPESLKDFSPETQELLHDRLEWIVYKNEEHAELSLQGPDGAVGSTVFKIFR